MPAKWRDIRQGKMSAARVARADKHVRETLAKLDLRELRKISGKTQAQVAAAMKVSQGQISETEGRADYRLSTLREYVKALGGEIEVFASFGDRKLRLSL